MNADNMFNVLTDNLKVVAVRFKNTEKVYHYKTFTDFEIGDSAVVDSPRNGLVVVEVVGHDNNLASSYKLKWIVQKVDLDQYARCVEYESQVVSELNDRLNDAARTKAKQFVAEQLGVCSVHELGLDNFTLKEEEKV